MNLTAAQLALEGLTEVLENIEKGYPPPYNFPSDDGLTYHILNTAIDQLKQLVTKNVDNVH